MPLDKISEAAIAALKPGPKLWEVPIEQMRQEMVAGLSSNSPHEEMQSVEDINIPGPASELLLRIYQPRTQPDQLLSALIYFHGGGFAFGDLDSHDSICRALAKRTPCIVLAVNYRMAPEHPFPAAVEDCYAAVQWIHANAKVLGAASGKLAIGGDSAGANLAAVTASLARDYGSLKLVHQLLVYPVVDTPLSHGQFLRKSYEECRSGLWDSEEAIWLLQQYLVRPEHWTDPRFAVIRANLKGLPSATVITCEVDFLRDEGKDYAEKLKAAGVSVNALHFEGTFHGFLHFPVPQAGDALSALAADLSSAFSS